MKVQVVRKKCGIYGFAGDEGSELQNGDSCAQINIISSVS
jgi:hypothetical protein